MALIIEDGTGLENADSWATLAEANTYHADRNNTAWASLSDAQKEARLRYAATLITGTHTFRGYPWSETQALAFPRDCWSGIPLKIKQAQIELALVETLNSAVTPGVKRERVDVIEIEYDTRDGAQPVYPVVEALLAPFKSSGGGRLNVRIGRG